MTKSSSQFNLTLSPRTIRMGLLYLAFELLALPSILSLVLSAMGVESAAVLNFIYFLVNFLFCFRIFRDLLAESLARLWTRPKQLLLWAVIGFAVNYAISLWLNRLIFILSPEFSNANDSAVISLIDQSPVLMLLGTALLVPVAEECLFRGLIFTTLRQKSRLAAYLISAAAFCFVHVTGYLTQLDTVGLLISLLQYVPAGLCLAWAYDRSESLFAPMLIHSTVNLMSYLSVRLLYA